MVQALRYEQNSGDRLTDGNLRYIDENEIDVANLILTASRTGMTMQRMLNYLKKQMDKNEMRFEETRRLYNDYLDMAEERGMDVTDEIVSRNARMREFHDKYTEEKNREENEKRDREVEKNSRKSEKIIREMQNTLPLKQKSM